MNERDKELALQAGLYFATDVNWMPIIGMEYAKKFADLIRADEREARSVRWDELIAKAVEAEREACAKVCEHAPEPDGHDLAQRIRARGNT